MFDCRELSYKMLHAVDRPFASKSASIKVTKRSGSLLPSTHWQKRGINKNVTNAMGEYSRAPWRKVWTDAYLVPKNVRCGRRQSVPPEKGYDGNAENDRSLERRRYNQSAMRYAVERHDPDGYHKTP